MTSVPGFLTKTFEIFSSPEYADCCGWGPNGDTIIIRKIEQFSKQILPKYFKHSNFQSFVRQLNMYDFHKTVQDPNHGEFQHQYFRQNQPELLIYIKRKANNRGTETLKKFSTSSGKQPTTQSIPPMPLPPSSSSSQNLQNSVLPLPVNSSSDDPLSLEVPFTSEALTKLLPEEIVQETDSVFQELELQKLMREDFEKRMEEKLSKVEGENQMLKRLFFESHQKNLVLQERMERVLKTLYSVFVGGQAGKALNGRMPSMLLTEYPPQANSGQPLKAILDKDSAVEDNKGTKRRSSRQHKSSNQYDLDTPLLDLSSFEKLPSIDFGNSSSYEGGTSNVEQYMQIKNSLAGKELSRSDRITSSFDYAAASVAPPLRYLPSFDSTYFSPTPEFNLGDDNNSLVKSMNGSENYHSDRVTLLSEDTDNSGADPGQRLGSGSAVDDRVALGSSSSVNTRSSSRRNARSSNDLPSNALTHSSPTSSLPTSQSDSYLQSRERSSKRAHEPDQSVVDRNQIKEGDTIASLPDEFVEKRRKIGAERGESHALQSLKLPNNDETLPQSKPSSEDIQLMDLLHRNQDSTLTRLDSLEQTIATLLEGIEYDDPLPETDDAPLISNEDQASVNPSLTDTTSTGRNYANLSALAVSSTSQMYNQDDESADAAR